MKKITELNFDNTYRRLPAGFYQEVNPTPFEKPRLVSFNPDAAALIDLDPESVYDPAFPDYISGRKPIPGSEPVAMYYTGHQFGVYNPDIGDGRAVLLGEVRNSRGEKWDLHLKGSGRTRYSRVFDGRAVQRSVIREYLCSEAMHGLGIPTTRALCIIGGAERVERETMEPAAMMLRMAETHVRFGSFEAFHYSGREDYIKLLADYTIGQYFPGLSGDEDKYGSLLAEVTDRTAGLIALWQAYGFTHGVMNTDNMSVTGLTIDYGPFGFLETYDPQYVPNRSDGFGRYSFGNQPGIASWNLRKFARTLESLIPRERADEIVSGFGQGYGRHYLGVMRKKLGLGGSMPGDADMVKELLEILREGGADYTNFFRALGGFSPHGENEAIARMFNDRAAFRKWSETYARRLESEGGLDAERKNRMDSVNPVYILRNYLAEEAIRKAGDEGDYSEIERLRSLLKNPFKDKPGYEEYSKPAPESAKHLTVSCSS